MEQGILEITKPIFDDTPVTRIYIPKTERGLEGISSLLEMIMSLVNPKDIRKVEMAFGEMGHRLLEKSPLLAMLEQIYKESGGQAQLEIVHGPYVDTKTQRVFSLAQAGVIKLYRAAKYNRHHFIVITTATNEVIVLDEAIHSQTVWVKNKAGDIVEEYTSNAHTYYVSTKRGRYARYLKNEYDSRKYNRTTKQITEHPGADISRHPQLRFMLHTLSGKGLPAKFITQPLAILLDWPFLLDPFAFLKHNWLNKE